MTRLDPASQWSAAFRAQLERVASARGLSATVDKKDKAIDRAEIFGPLSQTTLRGASTSIRLRAITADDPERRRKAMQIFLEAALLKEFGEALQEAPEFSALVQQVIAQMYEDPDLRQACDMAGDALLISPKDFKDL